MALPLLLGLLGSGAAGAGALALSPLLAGAIGTGLGTAIQEKDLGAGIKSGLTAGLLGGIGGALTGGLGGAAAGGAGAGGAAAGNAVGQKGIMGMIKNMPSGMAAVPAPAAGVMDGGIKSLMQRGLKQGIMTGAGMGVAGEGLMQGLRADGMKSPTDGPYVPEPAAAVREYAATPRGYRPGKDAEHSYFTPSIYSAGEIGKLAEGGRVGYSPTGMGTMYLQAGGLADMQAQMPQEPNEKELVQLAIRAVREELPEEEAAIVLAKFVQSFGEEALMALVGDVQSGKADGPRGDVEGTVRGPGDGMDDLVPATMDDGSQDVLLSNDEFVVPADVVSGLGNGSTSSGASLLHGMMDRVRQERTGKKAQPAQIAAGGMLPA